MEMRITTKPSEVYPGDGHSPRPPQRTDFRLFTAEVSDSVTGMSAIRVAFLLVGGIFILLTCNSCYLATEAIVFEARKTKAVAAGSIIESASFTVRVPTSDLYVKRFDRSPEVLTLAEVSAGSLGNEYHVFPIAAASGEPPASALLRHYATHAPRDKWEVITTRKGALKGSSGQVDLRLQLGEGGYVATCECFPARGRMWVVSHLLYYPRNDGKNHLWRLEHTRRDLLPFARAFQIK